MKMEYSILWIEDEPHSVAGVKRQIEDFLRDNNFIPEIKFVTNMAEAEQVINEMAKLYDIVVSDLNLDDHHNSEGIQLISNLREKEYLGDIILYSSSSLRDVLNQSISDMSSTSPLIGVHIVEGRERELEGAVEEFIRFFIKKNLTIESTRGFILAEVSYIDTVISGYLLSELLTNDNDRLKSVINNVLPHSVIRHTNTRLRQSRVSDDEYTQANSVLDAFKLSAEHHIGSVTSTSLCKILSEYLELDSCSYQGSPPEDIGPYERLIHIRNDFAHKTNTRLQELYDDLGRTTSDIRRQFISHRELLREKGLSLD